MADLEQAKQVYLIGLKNAHAMEKQALSIMQPQLNRLEHYPAMSQRLQQHVNETEGQIARLDQVLSRLDESNSGLKDAMQSAMGSMAALAHTMAGDEVLKDSLANLAFENFEIAAYTSLITMARICGDTAAVSLLEQSLEEERRMAEWVEQHIAEVTETYIALRVSGETAKV